MRNEARAVLGVAAFVVLAMRPLGVEGAPTVITFEDLNAGSPGTPAEVSVSEQYKAQGVIFDGNAAFDYSKGLSQVPGFAHSGTKAMEVCFAQEFCYGATEIDFVIPQARIKLWAGQNRTFGGPDKRMRLVLRALRADGSEVGRATAFMDPSGRHPVPIGIPLEVVATSAEIVRATLLMTLENGGRFGQNGLALDDVEFDTDVPPPGCGASTPPGLSVTRPPQTGTTPDEVVFSANGNILELVGQAGSDPAAPITSAVVKITGPGGESRTLSLMGGLDPVRPGGGSWSAMLSEVLFAGRNEVVVTLQNCRGEGMTRRTVDLVLPNITATDLEVTQGIQNLSNEVPLIENKTTFVRFHVKSSSAAGREIPAGRASLRLMRDGDILDLEPVNLSNSRGGIFAGEHGGDRADRDGAFLFNIPAEWRRGTVTFEARVQPGADLDTDPNDNLVTRTLSFAPSPRTCVVFVPVHSHSGSASIDDPSFWPNFDRMRRVYPVSDRNAILPYRGSGQVEPFFHETGLVVTSIHRDWGGPSEVVASLWYYDFWTDDPDECPETHYFGMADPGFELEGFHGMASNHTDHAWGAMVPEGTGVNSGGQTMAHEIAHNFDIPHVNCPAGTEDSGDYPYDPCAIGEGTPDGFYGFNTITEQPIYPSAAGDMMSYSFKNNRPRWVSMPTYCRILAGLPPVPGKAVCPSNVAAFPFGGQAESLVSRSHPLQTERSSQEHLAVAGVIDKAKGTVTWGSFFRTRDPKPRLLAGSGQRREGDSYEIALLDNKGHLLRSHPFSPLVLQEESRVVSFGELVRYEPRTKRIALRRGGVELASRKVSEHSPKVDVLSPGENEECPSKLKIRWRGTDADGDRLRYTVQYSADDGRSFRPLAIDSPRSGLTVDTSRLPGGCRARVRVIASDGVNSDTATSAPFNVPSKGPTATILSPAADTASASGAPVWFRGDARSLEQSRFADKAFSWRSDRDGALGKGSELLTAKLSPGRHRITLTVRDEEGRKDTAERTVIVRHPAH